MQTVTVHLNHDYATAVPSLGSRIGPTAVLGVVPFIVVNSVDRQAIWALAHVCEKFLVIIPSATNTDTTVEVVSALFVVWLATTAHGLPDPVCAAFRPRLPRMPMNPTRFSLATAV